MIYVKTWLEKCAHGCHGNSLGMPVMFSLATSDTLIFYTLDKSRPNPTQKYGSSKVLTHPYRGPFKLSTGKVYSELPLIWTPEMRPPLYWGHFKMSQSMLPSANSPLKWGHPSNQDTLPGPKGTVHDVCSGLSKIKATAGLQCFCNTVGTVLANPLWPLTSGLFCWWGQVVKARIVIWARSPT